MAKGKPLTVCSREALGLLLDLAQEHRGHVRLRFEEKGERLEVELLADTEELARYFEYMVAKLPAALRAAP
ncbi:MAG: hypothetical protein KGR26_12980 [Cyanobacteria bacterium REEB65]|nr:hypothetical protein [Cyanobacteria bacterium REEB65]